MSDRKNKGRDEYKDRKRKEAFDDLEFVVEEKSKSGYKAADAFDELERSKQRNTKNKRTKRRIWPIVLIIIIVVVVILFLTYPKYAQVLPGRLGNLPIMGNEVTETVDDAGDDGDDAAGTADSGDSDVIDQNISALVTNYFSAYVTADFDSLPEYAYPLSSLEQGYISTIAEYVESYNDITCVRSDGPEDSSYFVTVTASVKLKSCSGEIPEIYYFYIKLDDSSMYTIDNLYSDFNRTYMTAAMDSDIYSAFVDYLGSDSVKETASEVSEKQSSVLSSKAKVKSAYEELESAISSWESSKKSKITSLQQESGNDLTDARVLNTVSGDSSVTESDSSGVRYAKTRVNIRKKPNTNAKIVTVVNKDKRLKVLSETSNGWYKVQFTQKGKKYTGYIMGEYTKKNSSSSGSSSAKNVTETSASGVRYAKTGVNIRKKPSTSAKIVTIVNKDKRFKVLAETSNGWYKVQFKKGGTTYTGYVLGEYTKKKK